MAKYAVMKGLECRTASELREMTLTDARIKACRLAKANPDHRIGIFKEDKYHISAGHYMPKLIEDVEFTNQYQGNEYYLTQWGFPGIDSKSSRTCKVSPKTGKPIHINKYWRYF